MIKLPGVPEDLGETLARLDGRNPTEDERLRLAPDLEVDDFLPNSTTTRRKSRRLDPDPVSILLAAIGALGSVASLAAYVEFRREKKAQRLKAR
ncbi:MAG: hypothetical protein OXR62_07495 [Ahrensia sp.]|nr:hypothetical protein [Ahrensia sp.]